MAQNIHSQQPAEHPAYAIIPWSMQSSIRPTSATFPSDAITSIGVRLLRLPHLVDNHSPAFSAEPKVSMAWIVTLEIMM